MTHIIRAVDLSKAAHSQHELENFHHAVGVARRVAADPRATDVHVATAYLQNIGYTARITKADMIRAGIPGDVVRAVGKLEFRKDENFLTYLRRVSECHDTALVAYHDFLERLGELDPYGDDDLVRRFRRAAEDLNEAVNLNTPRSG